MMGRDKSTSGRIEICPMDMELEKFRTQKNQLSGGKARASRIPAATFLRHELP
jgi:hypothetical protein